MKGITGNPVLDAYQRGGVTKVGAAKPAEQAAPAAPSAGGSASTSAVEVSISSQARDMAAMVIFGPPRCMQPYSSAPGRMGMATSSARRDDTARDISGAQNEDTTHETAPESAKTAHDAGRSPLVDGPAVG